MARIFNIYFTFDDTLHSAIVSVHTTPSATEYILGNLDTDIRLKLPSTVIVAASPGGLSFRNCTAQSPKNLMNAIIKGLLKHLHESTPLY